MRFIRQLKQRTEERRLLLLQRLLSPNTPVLPVFAGRSLHR